MKKQNKPHRLAKLMKHWDRANAEERALFLTRIDATSTAAVAPAPDVLPSSRRDQFAENGRYLSSDTKDRIEAVMRRRFVDPQAVMAEMGFSREDMSLALALARGSSLRLKIIRALEVWLRQHEEGQD